MPYLKRVIAGLSLAVVATQASAAIGCAVPPEANGMVTQITAGLNASRTSNALASVSFSPVLAQAASDHACDMSRNRFFSHRGSDGSDVQLRARRAGYQNCLIAENLAWGYPKPEQIIEGWMQSPGHRHNMLHGRVKEFGIGIVQGDKGPIWVLVLASRC